MDPKKVPIFRESIKHELEEGLSASMDTINANLVDLAARITTVYSPWFTRSCVYCKLKFRLGDRIRLCPNCEQAYHDDARYDLHCWRSHFSEKEKRCKDARRNFITGELEKGCLYTWSGEYPRIEEQKEQGIPQTSSPKITEQFLNGLEAIWTPFANQKVRKVGINDHIIGHNCPFCRFKIRLGDKVVKCPCGKCNTYFHNDIFRHLTCWNEWNGRKGNNFCPTSGEAINSPPNQQSQNEEQPI